MYRIFIIEDDPTIAQTLKKHLEGWDYKVECAKDFHKQVQERIPDMVLLDIMLPDEDGLSILKRIFTISLRSLPLSTLSLYCLI